MITKKKLIEVALPLEAINVASAREKSIRHGHPSTLHLWWARRPLAAARAVIFAQLVDDPSAHLQRGNIAPVDLAQASIGPGMAIFTRYAQVLESDDSPMTVRTALQLINQALDEFLSEQEGEYDSYTRFAITWFETYGMNTGPYGTAETLATARGVSVAGVVQAGILEAKGGKVRLRKREELDPDWDPQADAHLTIWECTQHLIRKLDKEGETGAAALLAKLDEQGDIARDLAYRLYQVCERKKWAEEALAYNGLVIAWPELTRLATQSTDTSTQVELEI